MSAGLNVTKKSSYVINKMSEARLSALSCPLNVTKIEHAAMASGDGRTGADSSITRLAAERTVGAMTSRSCLAIGDSMSDMSVYARR